MVRSDQKSSKKRVGFADEISVRTFTQSEYADSSRPLASRTVESINNSQIENLNVNSDENSDDGFQEVKRKTRKRNNRKHPVSRDQTRSVARTGTPNSINASRNVKRQNQFRDERPTPTTSQRRVEQNLNRPQGRSQNYAQNTKREPSATNGFREFHSENDRRKPGIPVNSIRQENSIGEPSTSKVVQKTGKYEENHQPKSENQPERMKCHIASDTNVGTVNNPPPSTSINAAESINDGSQGSRKNKRRRNRKKPANSECHVEPMSEPCLSNGATTTSSKKALNQQKNEIREESSKEDDGHQAKYSIEVEQEAHRSYDVCQGTVVTIAESKECEPPKQQQPMPCVPSIHELLTLRATVPYDPRWSSNNVPSIVGTLEDLLPEGHVPEWTKEHKPPKYKPLERFPPSKIIFSCRSCPQT